MTRKEDWPQRLEKYVNNVSDKEFDWETHHCLIFADGALEAVTGERLYNQYRAEYETESNKDLMDELGARGIYRKLVSIFGKSIPVSMAQRGDIVILKNPYSVGVCRGATSNFVGNDGEAQGVVEVPTLSCKYAFKVGR